MFFMELILLNSLIWLVKIRMIKGYTDLIKAYDKVNSGVSFEVSKRRGVPPTLEGSVEALYDELQATVSVNGKLSDSFNLAVGVKQVSVISGLL